MHYLQEGGGSMYVNKNPRCQAGHDEIGYLILEQEPVFINYAN